MSTTFTTKHAKNVGLDKSGSRDGNVGTQYTVLHSLIDLAGDRHPCALYVIAQNTYAIGVKGTMTAQKLE